VQEALTNVAKHAGARHVAVVLGRNDGHAVAVIEDDGIGFDLEAISQTPTPGRRNGERGRLGLAGMRERLTLVGGRLEIETSPGRGTTLIARIPLNGKNGSVSTSSTSV
jgi:signal transduction histidine kinase